MLYTPIKSIGNNYVALQSALLALERIYKILDTTSYETNDGTGTKVLKDIKKEIKFNDVCFSYDGQREVLHKVNLTVPVGSKVALVEVNSETDFCAKNAEFVAFAQKVADLALANNISDIEALKAATLDGATVAEGLTALVAKIGENLQLRRVSLVAANDGETLGVYVHSNKRIGVAVVLKGGDAEVAKHVAMHVCASKPDFVHPEDVSAEVVEHERQVQIDIAMKSGKPQAIAEKMVEGRMKKFTGEVSLTGQAFVMNPEQTVGQMLKEKNADAVSFVRLEVGEGIEKKVVDFAAEVQAQVAAAKA